MLKLVLAAATVLVLGACATGPGAADRSSCRSDGETLRVSGPTDDTMLHCFQSAGTFSRVDITSAGGSVRAAIGIGDIIAARKADLVVVGSCDSSCANYLLPVARTLTIRPGARIVLHGSVDPWAVVRGAPPDLFERQRQFAIHHAIHPGWLLMRTGSDAAAKRHGRSVSGDDESTAPVGESDAGGGGARYIIVEPSFLASCLPGVPTTWEPPSYLDDLAARPSLGRRLAAQGFRRSGTLRCVMPAAYPALD